MSYSRPLSRVLKAKGHAPLVTLADARAYILTIPERESMRPEWQASAAKLLAAADAPTPENVEAVTRQLEVALLLSGRADLS